MDECEANMAASAKHAQNERDARRQVANLERRMATLRLKYVALKQLRQEYVTLAISIRIVASLSFVTEKLMDWWIKTCLVNYPHPRVRLTRVLSATALYPPRVPQQRKQ